MIRVTIKEALERDDEENGQCIYYYHENDIVFYVGRSIHPFQRLQEHIGKGPRMPYPDAIGSLILDNRPISLDWFMDVYTLEELAPELCKRMDPTSASLTDIIESRAIGKLKPCLNATYRYERTPLPEQYIKHQIANKGAKYGEVK